MARGGSKRGGVGMFDFSENPVNVILMVIFIILLIVFIYYVYLWWNKQSTVVSDASTTDGTKNVKTTGAAGTTMAGTTMAGTTMAGTTMAGTTMGSSGYDSDMDKKNVKKTTESFVGRRR
jgi:hypothetical protein